VPGLRLIPSSWLARLALLALTWAVAATVVTLSRREVIPPPTNRPVQTLAADYVSSDSCRSCHPGNYASWHASFHRTMTQVARPENFAPRMDGVELSRDGVDYRIERHGDAFAVRSKPHDAPATAFSAPRDIVLLTGSHNLQVYWTETGTGRTLGQFPFAYLVADKTWAPMSHSFLVSPDVKQVYPEGSWNDGCITCHTTQGRSRPEGNGRFDSRVSEFGISCEACHSGGREHIAANRSPLRRLSQRWSGAPDPTIANPARMDGPTASLVCGACHSFQAFNDASNTATFDRDGSKFRPGMKQLDARWVAQPKGTDHAEERARLLKENPNFFGDSFWPDGMIRVTGRELNGTMASPCFQGGKFSCLSCHEMHPDKIDGASLEVWKGEHQMKSGMADGDQSCLQCHQKFDGRITAHTHHAAASAGSSCANCHMPHTTYGLLRALRSHTISSPSVRESVEYGRPNACNLCHLDQPLAWTAGKLEEWYGQKAPALGRDDRELSAGAQWLLKGDAGQRGLVAWSMGWTPAQQAAGREWFYPYLIFELNDPYAAVRFAAWKSLRSLPGFTDFRFDYTINDAQQKAVLNESYRKWWFEVRSPSTRYRSQTILDPTGMFRQDVFDRMLDQRSKRKMILAE
jgi:hypothetical protein